MDTGSLADILTWECLQKLKSRNLKADFLIVDVPTTDNVILGRPILYKAKVMITPYLLQIQYKSDDGIVGNNEPSVSATYRRTQSGKRFGSKNTHRHRKLDRHLNLGMPLEAQVFGSRNLKADFSIVDVPTTYNVILGRPILHKAKLMVANFHEF
ncbi:hypothetical protein Cgig2_008683 [Carnegiea gigantea]|uniref:Uncharacterized protein n=1 Tax=Carnegiea gigantea TaxID=171969 RepID=A0A9Q1Q887_9CARY|nr:hypothetical protein Cgig2_008683 [Carnegiea gigantea]